MSLSVFIPRLPPPPFEAELRAALDPAVELQTGEAGHAGFLVAGTPAEERLDDPDLRAVVVPYAGVPRRTLELVRARPHLALFNLHHNAAPAAETALALFLAAAKSVVAFDRALRAHDWRPRYAARRELLCESRTALVLGLGAIGRRVARACRDGLGMRVLAVRRTAAPAAEGFEVFGPGALPELLAQAHALFLCLPLTPVTHGLLGRGELALLPDRAVLVNVARAGIVDERALFDELERGRLSAGLDVWYRYPEDEQARACAPPATLPFHELENVVLSPHRAGHCDATESLRARHLAELLNAAARGEDVPNRVDFEAGY